MCTEAFGVPCRVHGEPWLSVFRLARQGWLTVKLLFRLPSFCGSVRDERRLEIWAFACEV